MKKAIVNLWVMSSVLVRGVFYHSGDTLWYDNTVPLLKPFHLDLALLAINGNDALRGVAGNLNGKEAAVLGKAIGAKRVIPCHYDMFTFNTADPKEFAFEAEKTGQSYSILTRGERFNQCIFIKSVFL
jgi:L-ascorbate metabolism protein UlaG (beta-lactamase superfamily)